MDKIYLFVSIIFFCCGAYYLGRFYKNKSDGLGDTQNRVRDIEENERRKNETINRVKDITDRDGETINRIEQLINKVERENESGKN